MNDVLAKTIEDNVPKTNDDVMNGVATKMMDYCADYLDVVIKSAMRKAIPGFEYLGYKKLTVEEECRTVYMNGGVNNNKWDVNEHHLYPIKLKFAFQGEPLERSLYLPYVSKGGIITLSGTKYHITPVLSDTVITPGYDNIFVRLLRDKIFFKRVIRTMRVKVVM